MSSYVLIISISLLILSGYQVEKIESFQILLKSIEKSKKSWLQYSISHSEKKDTLQESFNKITAQFLRPFSDHQSILFTQRDNLEDIEEEGQDGYSEEDYEFQENYRRVYNFTFDRSTNPNISMTVSFTIDKLASLLSNPSYLQKYVVPGIYTFLDDEAEPVFIHWSENMVPSIFKNLKEIQAMKKIATNQLNQVRRLTFHTNNEEEVYRKIQNLQITAVKMEIIPKAKPSMIEKVTSSLIKRIKPVMNKLLQQNEAEIMAILGPQSLSPSLAPTTRAQPAPTSSPTVAATTSPGGDKEVISPFQTPSAVKSTGQGNNHNDDDDEDDEELELNKENVDKVLDEVRPFLIADGGNVEVVSVNACQGTIELFLQGACGSCPSSTTTMKMGIERVLKENFPNVQSIVAVNQKPEKKVLTVEMIQELLSKLLPTIQRLGGTISIQSVDAEGGIVKVQFTGPDRLKKGIDLILKENELVKDVEYL